MKRKWNKPKIRQIGLLLAILLLIAFAATNCVFALRNIRKSQYRERVENANVLMEKISQQVENAVDFKWETIFYIRNQLTRESLESIEAAYDFLEECENDFEKNVNQKVLLIDSKGLCHTSDAAKFKWENTPLLSSGKDELYVSDYPPASDGERCIFYLTKLKRPVALDGTIFTHISLVSDMEELDVFFDANSYGDNGITYLIKDNGLQLYQQRKQTTELSGFYNVLSALEHADFQYETSIEKVKTDIQTRQNDCVNVVYNDTSYFVSYYHLSINNWIAMRLVEEPYVGSASKALARDIILNVVSVFAMLVGVLLVLIRIFVVRSAEKQRMINEQLSRAVEAEHAANEAKTRFLSAMSHDIRTPMNAIVGMTMLASKRLEDTPYIKECLHKIKLASDHLLTLINDILDISKVESGKMTLSLVPFSLADCVTNIINIIQPQIREKELRFNIRTHQIDHEKLYGDELRLNQIFINLLTNAVKFTEKGGRIDVDLKEERLEDKPGYVRITYVVADNGIGMSEEFQKNMYRSFARATDSRTSKIQGSGLGLAICRQMIDLMDGIIKCNSVQGQGTTFTVILDMKLDEETDQPMLLPPMKFLLVDDDEIFLETAADTLESFGVEVDKSATGEEALQKIRESHPLEKEYSFIIIDKCLPGIDGIDATREIRKCVGEEIPIILISAYDAAEFEEAARMAGANGVISKPFFRSVIYSRICLLLGMEKNDGESKKSFHKSLAGMSVLVAEDNDMNWEIIQAILEMYHIKVQRAENGLECVNQMQTAQEGAYDLILMDLRMPVMDGNTAAKKLRSSDKKWLQEIPIIAMTADAFSEDVQACINAGMNEHLAKPIDVDRLLKKLKKFAVKEV